MDDIFPPGDVDVDAAAILNPKSLCVSKPSQIDPNPNEFGQSGSQLIETRVFKSSPESVQTPMDSVNSEGDEKRKLRRMRNKKSSQIYRQRKKDYAEELEEKVRIMASTIQHLSWRMRLQSRRWAALVCLGRCYHHSRDVSLDALYSEATSAFGSHSKVETTRNGSCTQEK
ncbi:hypothetical protein R3W88_021081 [Solanum pinnatisectum]|uniref:BZIP domain-containing protein n=1 Tax=Solanum pinnatisectum TaxID=50273 RepID=A0AAV9LQZ4_9SOLN|nr:hypothetical protein R3W88_021081 [Solanum pinnatisectum]